MITAGTMRQQGEMLPVVPMPMSGSGSGASGGADVLAAWAESLGRRGVTHSRGCLRFAFYGRVSTEDWQDPVTSVTAASRTAASPTPRERARPPAAALLRAFVRPPRPPRVPEAP